jgi:hypothetical protein
VNFSIGLTEKERVYKRAAKPGAPCCELRCCLANAYTRPMDSRPARLAIVTVSSPASIGLDKYI